MVTSSTTTVPDGNINDDVDNPEMPVHVSMIQTNMYQIMTRVMCC